MIYSVDFIELSGKISHVDVSKYLHDLGWVEIQTKRENVKIFQIEQGNKFYQIDLPTSRELRDYKVAMYRAVEYIAQSVQKSVEQIILELLNPLSDILRLRIKEPDVEVGSIFVEDAIRLYDNAKKLVMATAMDIIRPQLIHVGRPDNQIVEFVNSCRFGQTEIGSYVVSLVCPISKINNDEVEQLSLFSDEYECANSLTRNVVNKLISSIRIVKDSINQGTLESVIYNNADSSSSISVNFLDALRDINIFRENSVLDITAKYAPTIKTNKLSDGFVSIDHDYYTPIDTLVRKIKNNQGSEKTYVGRIKGLDAAPDPSVRDKGKVNFVFINEDQNKATASVVLSKEDYNAAIEAHRNGKVVKVVGVLSGKTYKKIDCSYFEVI